MKMIRQLHLYLGCLFAPLIVYFCLSGVWQLFRLNDVPKEGSVSAVRVVLHEMSKPHTNSTLPGKNPKLEKSPLFNLLAVLMGCGMILTSLLGVVLAFRFTKQPLLIAVIMFAGMILPVLFLYVT